MRLTPSPATCNHHMSHQETILEIVRTVAKKDVSPASDESLFETGILDSFALADMVSLLEKRFGIQVPDSDLNPRKFDSLERIEQYVRSRA